MTSYSRVKFGQSGMLLKLTAYDSIMALSGGVSTVRPLQNDTHCDCIATDSMNSFLSTVITTEVYSYIVAFCVKSFVKMIRTCTTCMCTCSKVQRLVVYVPLAVI